MMQLQDWAMVTKSRGTFITPEMVKNHDLHIQNVVFVGKMVDSEAVEERKRFKSGIVKAQDGKKVSTDKEEFFLGEPSKEYVEFTEAVKQGMPIVFNWVIGKNCMLSANLYENGQVSYICEQIVGQNLENRTLTLANGKTVYIVWRNINRKMSQLLLKIDDWSMLYGIFPTREFPLQMDVFLTSQRIWEYKTEPYEWIFNSPLNFSILNEDIRTTRRQKNETAN